VGNELSTGAVGSVTWVDSLIGVDGRAVGAWIDVAGIGVDGSAAALSRSPPTDQSQTATTSGTSARAVRRRVYDPGTGDN